MSHKIISRYLAILFALILFNSSTLPATECEEEDFEEIELDLQTAISQALNNNRQLMGAKDNMPRAQYQVSVAYADFDLQMVPKFDFGYAGGGYAGNGLSAGAGLNFTKKFAWGTKINLNPAFTKVNKVYHANVNASVTQPILRGLGREANASNMRGAEFGLRSAARALYTAQSQLIYRTISALYDVIKAQKNVELNEESFLRVKKFFQAAKLKSKIGLSDSLDVYRAEIEMRQAEEAYVNSKDRFQDSEDALRDILALPPEIKFKIAVPLAYTQVKLGLEQAISLAHQNRVEVDQALDQVTENERLSKIAKDKLWPELNFVLNYSNNSQDQLISNVFRVRRESSWGIGFTTSTDYSLVAEKANYEQSLLAVESASRNVDQTMANLTFDVKKSLRQLNQTYERIELQEKQIHTAKGELRLSQIKFDRGMANNFDLIQAEKTLRTAELSYWNAIIDHIVGEYQLLGSVGMLIRKPCF